MNQPSSWCRSCPVFFHHTVGFCSVSFHHCVLFFHRLFLHHGFFFSHLLILHGLLFHLLFSHHCIIFCIVGYIDSSNNHRQHDNPNNYSYIFVHKNLLITNL